MRIEKVSVLGLFDRFNHDIEFNLEESVTIMIGPNGYGKTTILRILDRLFNFPPRMLGRMPFREVSVLFDDCSTLTVSRITDSGKVGAWVEPPKLDLVYIDGRGKRERFTPNTLTEEEDVPFPTGMIEDWVPDLDQVTNLRWRSRRTGEILNLDDVLEMYSEYLPYSLNIGTSSPRWLEIIREKIQVRFIGTERLTITSPARQWLSPFDRTGSGRISERTVRIYSQRLSEKVQETLTQYGTLSQSLDRTFPGRLVEGPDASDTDLIDLQRRLSEVEGRRSSLVEAGLLAPEEEGWTLPVIEAVDEARRGVLAVYAYDALRKLGVFDELYPRVDTFKRIANSHLLYKQVSVSDLGLTVEDPDGTDIELEMLSSGEQHELVLLFELLFETRENSLILIDEPELSLHVVWQEALLSDLQNMANLSKFHALLATHSPEIINDRWDLTVRLREPRE